MKYKKAFIWGGIVFGTLFLMWLFDAILWPFVVAFLLSYCLNPLVNRLQTVRFFNRISATVVVVVGFIVSLVGLFLILIPLLQMQITSFMIKAPVYANTLWDKIHHLIQFSQRNLTQTQLNNLASAVRSNVFNALNGIGDAFLNIISGGMAVFNTIALLLIIPIVLFYVLRDWPKITTHMLNLIPKKNEVKMKSVLSEINQTLSGFIRGQASVCVALAFYYAIGLSIIGLDLGIVVGILSGVLSFIPYFGFLTGVVLSILIALTQSGSWGLWIGLICVFAIGQVLEGYVLTPKLVGDKVGLHPVWVIFALLAGGALFGFFGILLAVPVAAVLAVLIRHLIAFYQTTRFYKGDK